VDVKVRHMLAGVNPIVLKYIEPRRPQSTHQSPADERCLGVDGTHSRWVNVLHGRAVLHRYHEYGTALVLAQIDECRYVLAAPDESTRPDAGEILAEWAGTGALAHAI
jgi:hypothetical protein